MKQQDRPSLDEQYQAACTTSDLGLPYGPESGTGAQGILAAAAWSETSMGNTLRRLRAQWEAAKPARKLPRPIPLLKAAGMSREQAKRQHNRERVEFAMAYHREVMALKRRIPEYLQAADQLMAQAVRLGFDEPEKVALAVLDRWLQDPQRPLHGDEREARLGEYLRGCLNRARAALVQGMRGHTKHELAQ